MGGDVDVAAIREAAEKATPGPWDAHPATNGMPSDGPTLMRVDSRDLPGRPIVADFDYSQEGGADAHYIATMDPPTTLALLDALDAARVDREELHTVVRMLAEAWIAADGEPATRDDLTALTTVNRLGAQLLAAINPKGTP